MHAVTIVGGELRWQEHPDPVPGAGEALVAVRAAGLNAADLLQRRGHYPAPPGWPQDVPGMEFAGEVVAVGAGEPPVEVGQRVMAICGGGAQAELVVVPTDVLLPVPDGVPWEQAGGFPETFSTALDALITQAGLLAGERVLISGAAGGVGTAAVQLAHASGATVVASARSAEHHERIRSLGADLVITPDEVADHGPYDVSLELVGASGVEAVLPHLATGARIVVIGVGGGGAKAEVNLLALMGARATLRGSTLRARSNPEKAAVAAAVAAKALPLLAQGALTVPVAETFPLAEAPVAYERFASGGKFGKLVLLAE